MKKFYLIFLVSCGTDTINYQSIDDIVIDSAILVKSLTCSQNQIDQCSAKCEVCIPGSGGLCSGTPANSDVICRASVTYDASVGGTASVICDPPEYCDGINLGCPIDKIADATVICSTSIRSLGPCDAPVGNHYCDGLGHCLERALPSKQCKAAGSTVCQPANYCDGRRTTCPIIYAPPGTDCGGGKTCTSGICK